MTRVAEAIAQNDQRFGIQPRPRRERLTSRAGGGIRRPARRASRG
jgi:hypothetical protein